MKKILIVSTVSRQFYLFEQRNIEVLNSLGYEVHGAANFGDANERLDELVIVRHPIDIQRSPLSFNNIKAYKQLKCTMKSENFDAIHCHSPIGGVLARLAAKSVGIKNTIYTAHGFHFYKGAPIINWLFYYPVEWWLSRYTDTLITINKEDYKRAQKKLSAGSVKYIPGIGLDIEKINKIKVVKEIKLKEINIPQNAFVLLSVGELNKNKNHEVIIKAIAQLGNSEIHYIICGVGSLKKYLINLISKLNLNKQVHLLGTRKDVIEICKSVDVFVFPSFREGLSVSLMESMASGLPILCSNIRGNNDLVVPNQGGLHVRPKDIEGWARNIYSLKNDKIKRNEFSSFNLEYIKKFDKENVIKEMNDIYIKLY